MLEFDEKTASNKRLKVVVPKNTANISEKVFRAMAFFFSSKDTKTI